MSTIKVALNNCYGGFRLSDERVEFCRRCLETNGIEIGENMLSAWKYGNIDRDDPILIESIESVEGDTRTSKIKIVEIPAIFKNHYNIEEYDGMESINFDNFGLVYKKCLDMERMSDSMYDYQTALDDLVSTIIELGRDYND